MILLKNEMSPHQMRRHHEGDAGYDICASEDAVCPPRGCCVVSTGLFVAVPTGYVGIVKSRSGLSFTYHIEVGAGVIDSGYRGEVKVKLYNFGSEPFVIRKLDRIAQMLVVPVYTFPVAESDRLPEASDGRGVNGFGSTGV